MSVININKHSFKKEVLESEKPVLLDIWAPWSGRNSKKREYLTSLPSNAILSSKALGTPFEALKSEPRGGDAFIFLF